MAIHERIQENGDIKNLAHDVDHVGSLDKFNPWKVRVLNAGVFCAVRALEVSNTAVYPFIDCRTY